MLWRPFWPSAAFSENHERDGALYETQVEAIHYLKTRPKEGMEIFKRYTRIDAPDFSSQPTICIPSCFRVPEIFPEDLKLVFEEVAMTIRKPKRQSG